MFDNLSRATGQRNLEWLAQSFPQVEVTVGDLRRADDVSSVVGDWGPDWILHLGAQVAVTTSVKEPRDDFETNALGTLNVLEAIRTSARTARLIYASTNKVYGSLSGLDVREDPTRMYVPNFDGVAETAPLDFYSPYGCSKGAADQYVIDYGRIYGLATLSIRQSCIYGPRQFGIEDQGWLAWFALRALEGRRVQVFGTGKQVRDVLHVDDLLRLYELAFTSNAYDCRVVNAGGGIENSLSILEYVNLLSSSFQLDLDYDFGPERPGDQKWFVSDNSKAAQVFGWRPHVGIPDGVASLLAWSSSVQPSTEYVSGSSGVAQ